MKGNESNAKLPINRNPRSIHITVPFPSYAWSENSHENIVFNIFQQDLGVVNHLMKSEKTIHLKFCENSLINIPIIIILFLFLIFNAS